MKKTIILLTLLASPALAQDPYGSYGSVPTVHNYDYNHQYRPSYPTYQQDWQRQQEVRQEAQKQLQQMSPYERAVGGQSNFGWGIK